MILLYGYYGERNAGDDAFTTICTNELAQRGHRQIGVLAAELPKIYPLPGVALHFKRRFRGLSTKIENRRINAWLNKGAQIVIGGGSLFRDSRSLIELEQLLARSSRSGHHAIGVSIGPFRDPEARLHCARLLRRLDSVGVRDEVSLQRARELAPEANVNLTFDLAPLLSRWIDPSPTPDWSESEEMGVALCGSALSEDGYDAIRGALTSWLREGRSRGVVLLPFNSHPHKGDLAVHQRLYDDLNALGSVEMYRYNGDPGAVWRRIARLNSILAMRLHAAVFGYCSERPVLIVPYEEKCTAWAEMVGQEPEFVVIAQELTGDHLAALSSRGRPTAIRPVAEAMLRARTNFSWAER